MKQTCKNETSYPSNNYISYCIMPESATYLFAIPDITCIGLGGSPVTFDHQYDDIIGEAFFSKDWMAGTAYTSTGKKYINLKLKFDVYANKLFADLNGTVYDVTIANISRFDLYPNANDTATMLTFIKGFKSADFNSEKYLQVLSQGKLSFVKYLSKDIKEVYENGPLDKQKKLIDNNRYYVVSEAGDAADAKLNKKSMEKIIGSKWNDVNKYASDNKLSFSSEEDWGKLIQYYNKL
ncbi:MAG: hypothetical protein QM764_13410 [Chitinophagaceae bacterium]